MQVNLKKIFYQYRDKVKSHEELKALIAKTCNINSLEIFLSPHKRISLFEFLRLRKNINQLIKDIPLAYILKCGYFLNQPYFVNRHVFIPRPETEELTTLLLNCLLSKQKKKIKLLDIGTGSGVIAISIKKENPNWEMDAIDIAASAIDIAKKNSEQLLSSKNAINFIQADILNYKNVKNPQFLEKKYDVIVSNPPYIAKDDLLLEQRVKQHEPHTALFAKENGFNFFKIISSRLSCLLKKNGELFVEFGVNQSEGVKEIFCHFNRQMIIKDLHGKERFFYGSGYQN